MHAEIRLVLHLNGSKQPSRRSLDDDIIQQAVSFSKCRCLCCQIWIITLNWYSQTEWLTSRPHGRMGPVGRVVDKQITTRLRDSLPWLAKGPKRHSDGHTSSGSEREKVEDTCKDRSRGRAIATSTGERNGS